MNLPTALFAALSLVAYFLKATTAFGSVMILVPVGALLVGSVHAVVDEAFLDRISGVAILRSDSVALRWGSCLFLGGGIAAGTIAGSLALSRVPANRFSGMLAALVGLLALWLVLGRPGIPETFDDDAPLRQPGRGFLACLFAGLLGGVSGISEPPLIFYFGSRLSKGPFPSVVTWLFLAESGMRIVVYAATGLVNGTVLWSVVLSAPLALLGVYMGNKVFVRLSERWFPRIIGVILLLAAIRLAI